MNIPHQERRGVTAGMVPAGAMLLLALLAALALALAAGPGTGVSKAATGAVVVEEGEEPEAPTGNLPGQTGGGYVKYSDQAAASLTCAQLTFMSDYSHTMYKIWHGTSKTISDIWLHEWIKWDSRATDRCQREI